MALEPFPVEIVNQQPEVWNGPTVLTLVVAVAAALISSGSLGWQIYSWRSNAPKIDVDFVFVYLQDEMGLKDKLMVTVTNRGRAETYISDAALSYGHSGENLPPFSRMDNVEDSHLPPGATRRILISPDKIVHICKVAGFHPNTICVYVRTGHTHHSVHLDRAGLDYMENKIQGKEPDHGVEAPLVT